MKAALHVAIGVGLLYSIAPPIAQSRSLIEARKELAQMHVSFTRDAFINAAKESDTVVVQLFLAAGMNANVKDEEGKTALIWTATGGHVGTMDALLTGGADVNAQDKKGRTALMWAARAGSSNQWC